MKTTDCAHAAELLLQARATHRRLEALPDGARPRTEAEAYAIQDMVAYRFGPVVGWKVGSATLQSEPFRAPIHSATLRIEDPRLPAEMFHVIGVEAEIVYRFAHDLPPRAIPYTRIPATRFWPPSIQCIQLSRSSTRALPRSVPSIRSVKGRISRTMAPSPLGHR